MGNLDPFTVLLGLFFLFMLGYIGYFVYNLTRPTVTRKAKLIGKQKKAGMSTAQCTFEFEDGTNEYYDVSLDTYASLAVNDAGYLSTRGLVFWGFRREGEGVQNSTGSSLNTSIPVDQKAHIREALSWAGRSKLFGYTASAPGQGWLRRMLRWISGKLTCVPPNRTSSSGPIEALASCRLKN
jgi:hypothetical protein